MLGQAPPNNSLDPTRAIESPFGAVFVFVAFQAKFGVTAPAARRVNSHPLGGVRVTDLLGAGIVIEWRTHSLQGQPEPN